MRIVVPASGCLHLSAEFLQQVWVIGQRAKIGKKSIFFDKEAIQSYISPPKQILDFSPVALPDLVSRLGEATIRENLLFISSSHFFDATPYSSLLQAILFDQKNISRGLFDSDGVAFAFLVKAVIRFVQDYQPSREQVELFMEGLNGRVITFMISSDVGQPETGKVQWQSLLFKVLQKSSIFRTSHTGWQPCPIPTFSKILAEQAATETLFWVESRKGQRHWQTLKRHFGRAIIDPSTVVYREVTHLSQRFPSRFLWLTLTPNKSAIQNISKQIMRRT
ncbi:MAG: hypothetical protein U0175_06860 [Caldilineaceae bacterium]